MDHTKNKHTKKVEIQLKQKKGHPVEIPCKKCDFKCRLNIQLRKHTETVHDEPEKNSDNSLSCDICKFEAALLPDIWKHKLTMHATGDMQYNPVENSSTDVIWSIIAVQTATIMEEFNNLKAGLEVVFEQIVIGIQGNFDALAKVSNSREERLKCELESIYERVNDLGKHERSKSKACPPAPMQSVGKGSTSDRPDPAT